MFWHTQMFSYFLSESEVVSQCACKDGVSLKLEKLEQFLKS